MIPQVVSFASGVCKLAKDFFCGIFRRKRTEEIDAQVGDEEAVDVGSGNMLLRPSKPEYSWEKKSASEEDGSPSAIESPQPPLVPRYSFGNSIAEAMSLVTASQLMLRPLVPRSLA